MSFNNMPSQAKRAEEKTLVNSRIRARQVLVIDGETNDNLGVLSLSEALRVAGDKGLDLVQVGPPVGGNPPTCKLLDYGKFRYDESKRQKAIQKKQRESQIKEKEITFCPDTAANDLKIKAKKASEFLDEGAKVRVNIKCRGREGTHLWVIQQALDTFVQFIPDAVVVPTSAAPVTSNVKLFSYFLQKVETEVKKK